MNRSPFDFVGDPQNLMKMRTVNTWPGGESSRGWGIWGLTQGRHETRRMNYLCIMKTNFNMLFCVKIHPFKRSIYSDGNLVLPILDPYPGPDLHSCVYVIKQSWNNLVHISFGSGSSQSLIQGFQCRIFFREIITFCKFFLNRRWMNLKGL